MKGLREDLLSVAAVLSVLLALALAFPREAICFVASRDDARGMSTDSIVFLDASAAAKALRATKILPRGERGGIAADLLPAELPGPDAVSMMSVDLQRRPPRPSVVESGLSPFLPSRRAPSPVRISGGKKADDGLPFPRSELLKLN